MISHFYNYDCMFSWIKKNSILFDSSKAELMSELCEQTSKWPIIHISVWTCSASQCCVYETYAGNPLRCCCFPMPLDDPCLELDCSSMPWPQLSKLKANPLFTLLDLPITLFALPGNCIFLCALKLNVWSRLNVIDFHQSYILATLGSFFSISCECSGFHVGVT